MKKPQPGMMQGQVKFETDHISLIASPQSKHQVQHMEALKEGLAKFGITGKIVPSRLHARAYTCIVWGWRSGKVLRDQGRDVMVVERGYIGDRMSKWSSLSLNGLNGNGRFPIPPDDQAARFKENHLDLYKPWNPDGDYVLLIGQVAGDAALQGKDLGPWYQSMCDRIVKTGQRCVFRQHPVEVKRGIARKVRGAEISSRSLEQDLANARLVVTFNSNVGVDASLAGKPIVAFDKGSMAYSMGKDNTVEQWATSEPENRAKWAADLSWCQWTLEEMRSGEALRGFLLPGKLNDTMNNG